MSVGKIPRKFTDRNIPSVFPFVFIGFLVVFCFAMCCKIIIVARGCIIEHAYIRGDEEVLSREKDV
jgi:hypothetical protein